MNIDEFLSQKVDATTPVFDASVLSTQFDDQLAKNDCVGAFKTFEQLQKKVLEQEEVAHHDKSLHELLLRSKERLVARVQLCQKAVADAQTHADSVVAQAKTAVSLNQLTQAVAYYTQVKQIHDTFPTGFEEERQLIHSKLVSLLEFLTQARLTLVKTAHAKVLTAIQDAIVSATSAISASEYAKAKSLIALAHEQFDKLPSGFIALHLPLYWKLVALDYQYAVATTVNTMSANYSAFYAQDVAFTQPIRVSSQTQQASSTQQTHSSQVLPPQVPIQPRAVVSSTITLDVTNPLTPLTPLAQSVASQTQQKTPQFTSPQLSSPKTVSLSLTPTQPPVQTQDIKTSLKTHIPFVPRQVKTFRATPSDSTVTVDLRAKNTPALSPVILPEFTAGKAKEPLKQTVQSPLQSTSQSVQLPSVPVISSSAKKSVPAQPTLPQKKSEISTTPLNSVPVPSEVASVSQSAQVLPTVRIPAIPQTPIVSANDDYSQLLTRAKDIQSKIAQLKTQIKT
jgi:hypothetical protein